MGKHLPYRVEVEQRVFRSVAYSLYRLLRVALLLLFIFVIVTVVDATYSGLLFLVLLPLKQN